MKVSRLTKAQALPYFEHKTQRVGFLPDELPDESLVDYWACGPICLLFIYGLWPDVWNVHCAVKPEGWGKLEAPATEILNAFWDDKGAKLITAWTAESNPKATALARRVGFFDLGAMPHPDGNIIMQGWKKCPH